MKKQPVTVEEVQKKVKAFYAETEKTLKKLGLKRTLGVTFPKRTHIPFLSRIATRIIHWQGGRMDERFTFTNKK